MISFYRRGCNVKKVFFFSALSSLSIVKIPFELCMHVTLTPSVQLSSSSTQQSHPTPLVPVVTEPCVYGGLRHTHTHREREREAGRQAGRQAGMEAGTKSRERGGALPSRAEN